LESDRVSDRDSTPDAQIEDVYRTQGARLWRALVLQTRNPDVASDAVAEAFAQALRRGAEIVHPDRWIWKAAFRLAAGELKRRSQERAEVDDAAYEFPDEAIHLAEALARLSPMQRGSIILRYYGGYSSSEIASILGSSNAAVRVHLFRGRRRLSDLMEVLNDD
jgi:RNA polymerase sigma-70 factor (ECF subfamily)